MVIDKRDGKDVFTYLDKRKYDGQWSKGLKNGRGLIIYSNGESREVNYRNGILEGKILLLLMKEML